MLRLRIFAKKPTPVSILASERRLAVLLGAVALLLCSGLDPGLAAALVPTLRPGLLVAGSPLRSAQGAVCTLFARIQTLLLAESLLANLLLAELLLAKLLGVDLLRSRLCLSLIHI